MGLIEKTIRRAIREALDQVEAGDLPDTDKLASLVCAVVDDSANEIGAYVFRKTQAPQSAI